MKKAWRRGGNTYILVSFAKHIHAVIHEPKSVFLDRSLVGATNNGHPRHVSLPRACEVRQDDAEDSDEKYRQNNERAFDVIFQSALCQILNPMVQ